MDAVQVDLLWLTAAGEPDTVILEYQIKKVQKKHIHTQSLSLSMTHTPSLLKTDTRDKDRGKAENKVAASLGS